MKFQKALHYLARIGWLLAVISIASCDESLPPREDPKNLFGSRTNTQYIYSDIADYVLIDLALTNNFDETLSDTVKLEGTLVVSSIRDPSVHKTFSLSVANLKHGRYDPISGLLTVDPGDSVVFTVTWDFFDDSNRDLRSSFFNYSVDPSCSSRLISDVEYFAVDAKAKLFSPLGYGQSRYVCSIRRYNSWVSPKDCHPL